MSLYCKALFCKSQDWQFKKRELPRKAGLDCQSLPMLSRWSARQLHGYWQYCHLFCIAKNYLSGARLTFLGWQYCQYCQWLGLFAPIAPRAYSPAQNHWQSWQWSNNCQDCQCLQIVDHCPTCQWLQSLEHDPNCQWLQIADHCLNCQSLQTLENDPNCQSVFGFLAWGPRVGPTAWQVRAGGSTRNFFIFISFRAH